MKHTLKAPALVISALILAAPAVAQEHGSKSGLFNSRYCEILAAKRSGLKAIATVYSTVGLNTCPATAWNGIDEKAVSQQLGVDGIQLNGPRYWVIDGIKGKGVSANGKTIEVNGIVMSERATLEISLSQAKSGKSPYKPTEVKRDTVFTYRAGKPIFELADPEGHVYRMQSYAQIVNKTASVNDLTGLGATLKLPKGWTYSTRILDKDDDLVASGVALVVQDDFLNSYQRLSAK